MPQTLPNLICEKSLEYNEKDQAVCIRNNF